MSAEFVEIVFGGKYFKEKVFVRLMKVDKFLAWKVCFEHKSHEEVFGHSLSLKIGLFVVVHRHCQSNITSK